MKNLSLIKRQNGYWYISYPLAGKRKYQTTKVQKKPEALEFLTNWKQLQEESNKPKSILFSDFEKQFPIWHGSQISKRTFDSCYATVFKQWKQFIGDKPLENYSPQDVEMFKSKKLADKCKPISVNGGLRSLNCAFSVASKLGYLKTNIFREIRKCRVEPKPIKFLTLADFQKVLEKTKEEHLKQIFTTCFLTGGRISEVLSLKWENIDFQSQTIRIDGHKTQGSNRIVPIHVKLIDLLKVIPQNGGYIWHKKDFPNVQLTVGYISHAFKKSCRAAKLDNDFHLHSLRKSFGSLLVGSGVGIFEVSKLLGHSSVSTTEKSYAHLYTNGLHATVNKISF
jgi:integrase